MAAKFILIIALLKLIAAADIEPDPLQQQVRTGCIGGDCVNGSAINAAFPSLKHGKPDDRKCKAVGGVCQEFDTKCDGKVLSGKKYCKSKKKFCCKGCPKDFFMGPGSEQCFKFINTKYNWTNGNAHCQQQGLVLAKPYNPIAVRSYLLARYGSDKNAWVDGRGDNTNMIWQRDSIPLLQSSPWWLPSRSLPVTTDYCLAMIISDDGEKDDAGHPYYSTKCIYGWYTLCELI